PRERLYVDSSVLRNCWTSVQRISRQPGLQFRTGKNARQNDRIQGENYIWVVSARLSTKAYDAGSTILGVGQLEDHQGARLETLGWSRRGIGPNNRGMEKQLVAIRIR